MSRLFGTDGVRGVANIELTGELAFKIGKYGAYVLTKGNRNSKIIIGKDPRVSSYMLEAAIMAGIMSSGCDAYLLGVVPTPSLPHLIEQYDANAAVMISASHNSAEFNGIKFFGGDGYKLSDEIEDEIQSYIDNPEKEISVNGDCVGRRYHHFESTQYYGRKIIETLDEDFTLEGYKVAMDCANGASFVVAPSTLRELDAELITINNYPNGFNINKDCGSTHIEKVQALVTQIGADIGIAFDGDADRMLAVDELGNIVDGDQIINILAIDMKERGLLKNNTVVATIMSNMGLEKALKSHGIKLVKTGVGDRYVLEHMRANGYNLGGEQSGHIILSEFNKTGDGLLSAISLMSVMKRSGKKLSELAGQMKIYPQVLKNVKVSPEYKRTYMENEELKKLIEKYEDELSENGRILIRASGTEPLIRVMLEGLDEEQINRICDRLVDFIKEQSQIKS